jgi:DNA-binding response OmpR family regulator
MGELSAKTILHIEDDESIRDCLGYALQDEGYVVHTAVNGREALDFLSANSKTINLILLDVMMPVMDGFSFYTEKSKIDSYAEIPTIIYSADDRFKSKANAIGLPFISKPFNMAEMFDKIKKYGRG